MTSDSIWQLQKAMYSTLDGDSTLAAMVTGVYDFIPEKTNFPYVVIGETKAKDISNVLKKGAKLETKIEIFTRDRGSKTCLDIMARVKELLHEANITVTNHTLVNILSSFNEISQQKSGLSYHGVMKFEAILFSV